MRRASKPAIALERVIWHMGFTMDVPSFRRNNHKPGSYIERLPKVVRDQLKDLKSSDVQNVSPDFAGMWCKPPGFWKDLPLVTVGPVLRTR